MVGTITRETKREGQRKVKRRIASTNQKKKEKASPFHGMKLFQSQPLYCRLHANCEIY
jgi:hypothetical protein